MERMSENLQRCFETSTEPQFLHMLNGIIILLGIDLLGGSGQINKANADELVAKVNALSKHER